MKAEDLPKMNFSMRLEAQLASGGISRETSNTPLEISSKILISANQSRISVVSLVFFFFFLSFFSFLVSFVFSFFTPLEISSKISISANQSTAKTKSFPWVHLVYPCCRERL